MNDRWGTLAWMVLTVSVAALLLWPKSGTEPESRPLSTDTRAAGLAGLQRWLSQSGIATSTLRQRYTALAQRAAEPAGDLLIVHVPMLLVPETDEVAALHRWAAAGNTVLISTSLMESPPWHLTGGSVTETTEMLAGIDLDVVAFADDDVEETDEGEDDTATRSLFDVPAWIVLSGSSRTERLASVADHPLSRGLDEVHVPWDGTRVSCCQTAPPRECPAPDAAPVTPAKAERPASPDAGNGWRTLLRHVSTGQAVAWERQIDHGSIIVVGHPSLFANAAIHQHGNRRFVMNLIAERVGEQSRVLFDDAHQGDNDLYTPRDLLGDIRVLYTVGFLLMCWAVYLLADAGTWQRLTTARLPTGRGHADLVHASGGYLARRLHGRTVADGLLEPLRDRLAKKWQLPRDQALERGLELERQRTGDTVDYPGALRACLRRPVNLVKLHNLLLEIRRNAR